MRHCSLHPVVARILLGCATLSLLTTVSWSASYHVLYKFGKSASAPSSGLVLDDSGNAYGTTADGGYNNAGTVYQLSPLIGFHIIYAFRGLDGRQPIGNLALDSAGNLYGTTVAGGAFNRCNGGQGCGTVFKLSPPANGQGAWTEAVLYSFGGQSDGANPQGGVVLDSLGNLYGTTYSGGITGNPACPENGCGTIFELQPSDSGWTETVLHAFSGDYFSDAGAPRSRLVFDASGNLYGTSSLGTAFEISPTFGGLWTMNVIHRFSNADGGAPFAGLIFDGTGNLYGTTMARGEFGFGNVFELTLGPEGWTETVLYNFKGGIDGSAPEANLVFDKSGNLYGTTVAGGAKGAGTIFRLMAAEGQWQELSFALQPQLGQGSTPAAPILLDAAGNLYGTTSASPGVVFQIAR